MTPTSHHPNQGVTLHSTLGVILRPTLDVILSKAKDPARSTKLQAKAGTAFRQEIECTLFKPKPPPQTLIPSITYIHPMHHSTAKPRFCPFHWVPRAIQALLSIG
jgi:hypothetical protein